MCLASGGDVRTTWPDIANAIIEANRLHPRVRGYNMLWRLNANRQFPTRNFIAYLESEYARLGTMNYNSAGGRRFLACRDTVADMLFKLHGRAGRKQQADKWGREAEFVRNELNKLHVKWGKAPLKRAAK